MAHVNEESRGFTCSPHVIHNWNESCLLLLPITHHCTLAVTHFCPAEHRRLELAWVANTNLAPHSNFIDALDTITATPIQQACELAASNVCVQRK